MAASTLKVFQFYMDEAAKYLAKGDVQLAYRNADYATQYLSDQASRDQEAAFEAKLLDQAKTILADANAKYDAGKYAEALASYRILIAMPRLATAGDAQNKLRDAEKNPDVAIALRESKAAILYDQVELLLGGWTSEGDTQATSSDTAPPAANAAEGKRSDCVDDFVLAKRLGVEDRVKLKNILDPIAKRFGDTPTGQKADKLLQQMLADPAFASVLATRSAVENDKADYLLGKAYALNRAPDKAREYFQKVMARSPDSPWAQKARQDLESLGAANP